MLLSFNNLIYRVIRSSILFVLSQFATVAVAVFESDSAGKCTTVSVPAATDISIDDFLSLYNSDMKSMSLSCVLPNMDFEASLTGFQNDFQDHADYYLSYLNPLLREFKEKLIVALGGDSDNIFKEVIVGDFIKKVNLNASYEEKNKLSKLLESLVNRTYTSDNVKVQFIMGDHQLNLNFRVDEFKLCAQSDREEDDSLVRGLSRLSIKDRDKGEEPFVITAGMGRDQVAQQDDTKREEGRSQKSSSINTIAGRIGGRIAGLTGGVLGAIATGLSKSGLYLLSFFNSIGTSYMQDDSGSTAVPSTTTYRNIMDGMWGGGTVVDSGCMDISCFVTRADGVVALSFLSAVAFGVICSALYYCKRHGKVCFKNSSSRETRLEMYNN